MSIIKRLEKGEPLTYQELDNNFSVLVDMINSLEIPEISNVLTSFDTTQGLSANQGRVLAEYIIDIQGKLSSDDPALDTLQKIVNYLKAFSDAVPPHVREISSTDIDNWEEAHSWGDHSEAGYLTESTSDNKGSTLDIDAGLLADYEKSTIVNYINNLDPSYVKEDIDSTFVRILKEDKVVKAFVLLNTTKGSIGLNDKKITADDLQVIDGKTYHKVNNFSTYRGYGILHADADPNDGSIYVFGRFSAYKGQPVNNFIKLKPNGELDENFITTGINAVQYFTQALHVNADGTVFLVGWFTTYNGTSANRIVKILPTGEIDTSFNYGSGFNNGVTGVYVDEVEQKIYVLGYFTTYNGVSATRIVKINWDGSRDTSFVVGGGFNNIPVSLAFIGDHIYVSGYFTWFNGTSVSHLVKLSKATGAIDTSFVSKGFNIGSQHGLYLANHQNKLLCHGGFTTYGGQPHRRLLRLNSDGSVDTTFDVGEGFTRPVANDTPSGSAWIKWLHIEPDDSIYICLDDTVMLHKGQFMGSVVKISPTGAILNNYTRVNVRNQGLFKFGNTFYLSVISSFDPEGYGNPDSNQTCSLSPIDFNRGVEYEYRGYKLLDNGRIISSANNALNTTNEETSFISRTETKGVIKDYLNHTLSSVVDKLTPTITSSDGSVVIDSTTTSGTIDLSVSGGSEGESVFRIETDPEGGKNYISIESANTNVLTSGSDNLIMSESTTIEGGASNNIVIGSATLNHSYQNIMSGWGVSATDAWYNYIGGTNNSILEGDGNIISGNNNQVLGDMWNSVMLGQNNEISGYVQSSVILGEGTIATDTYRSLILGGSNEIGNGYESLFIGNGIKETYVQNANSGRNVGLGYGHEITGGYNYALGFWHKLQDYFTTAVGISATTDGLTSPRFIVGIGEVVDYPDPQSPKNGFVVLQSGEVVAPELTSELIDTSTSNKVLITKEYFEANSGGGELPENIVESISLNGGTPVLPVDGNVDLTIEIGGGGAFRKETTPDGDSYILEYYDVDNYVTSGGNIIMGKNNSIGNGSENLLFTRNTTLTNNAWHNLIHGVGHTLNGAVRYAVFGEYNTISNGAQDGIAVGNNIENQIQLSALFGTQLTNNFTNTNWIGDTNFMQGRKNTLRGGRYTSVFGEFHDIGNGVTPVNGAMIIGSASDYTSLPSQPSFLIGGGDINYSGHSLVSRANNFAVMKTGEVLAFQSDNTKIDAASGKVLLTKEYVEANYIKKPTQVFEDNASALSGGLNVDDTYRTADGTIKIVF